MDVTTANAIVSASAALVGGVIGGMTTYVTAARQHKRQVEKERAESKRSQEVLAAKECEDVCSRMAEEMEKVSPPGRKIDDDAIERRGEHIRQLRARFDASFMVTGYVPGMGTRVFLAL